MKKSIVVIVGIVMLGLMALSTQNKPKEIKTYFVNVSIDTDNLLHFKFIVESYAKIGYELKSSVIIGYNVATSGDWCNQYGKAKAVTATLVFQKTIY